jgi:hypothetical protein
LQRRAEQQAAGDRHGRRTAAQCARSGLHRLSPLFWACGTIPLASLNGGILASGTLPDAFAQGREIWGISMKRGMSGAPINRNHFYSMLHCTAGPNEAPQRCRLCNIFETHPKPFRNHWKRAFSFAISIYAVPLF